MIHEKRRITVLIIITAFAFGACDEGFLDPDDRAKREFDTCVNTKPVNVPRGAYRGQHVELDYSRLLPAPGTRNSADQRYTRHVYADSRRLEQAYYDATHGNQQAALFVCLLEANMRNMARGTARYLASPSCVASGECVARIEKLNFLARSTTSGARLRTIFSSEFRQQARTEQLKQDVVMGVLAVFVAGKVAMGMRTPKAAATAAAMTTSRLPSTFDQLTAAATRAHRAVGPGRGPVHGTRVHTAFKREVQSLGRSDLHPEVSYRRGEVVRYGEKGSVRLDVVEGPIDAPRAAYDLKTGKARLSAARIKQIREHLPDSSKNIPVVEIR